MSKIILIGANGKIGELVQKALAGAGHDIVKVGHKAGDFQVEIESRESVRKLYQAVGSFDAVAIAAGQVAFAPLSELTAEKWQFSLGSKLMGQINLVQEAIPFIKEKGSFTLVSGILNSPQMLAADDFAELLHTTRVTVNTQRKSGRLLGLEGATRGFRFPTWQLNEEGKPYRELASLHDMLGGAWPVLRFLTYPQAELGGSTGRAALEQGRGAEVLKAAESVGRDFS